MVEPVDADEAAAHPASLIHLHCLTEDIPPVPVHVLVPRSDAVTLAGLQLGEDESAIKERRDQPLEPDHMAAFEGVMKLAVAVLGRLYEEDLGRSAIQLEGTAEIEEPGTDPSWLESQQLMRISYDLSIKGFSRGQLDVLFSIDGPGAQTNAQREAAAPGSAIDASEEERERVEELEAELERQVMGLDPNDMIPGETEDLAAAAVVIVAWDLGGRPGLELVESLLWNEETEAVPILMASEAPTRGMVTAALRAGARSFLHRPYDAAEIRRRAFGGGVAPAPAE